MSKTFVPYYVSRALVSALFSTLLFGLTWKAALSAGALFALFLVFLHSGWFVVDPARPWSFLRRDERGQQVQRKALVAAIALGATVYVLLAAFTSSAWAPLGSVAIAVASLAYLGIECVLLART